MRTITRTTAATLLAFSLLGCIDESDLTSPRDVRPSRYEGGLEKPRTVVSNPDIELVGVEVRMAGLETPLRYQIPLNAGESTFPLSLPVGKEYELAVRGYDRYGQETFQGKSAIGYIEPGNNAPLAVDLFPLGEGERANLRFDVVGEERTVSSNLQIVIEADRKEIAAGQSMGLRAYGLDRGRRVALDPTRLQWSMEDPTGGRFNFDPRRPTTEQDKLSWIARHADELRPEKVFVTYEVVTGSILVWLLPNGYVDVSAGEEVTCGVRSFGELFCWGSNTNLMLGIGNTMPPDRCTSQWASNVRCSVRPMAVGGALRFSSVSVGRSHVCALQTITGAAFCWGHNAQGQVGIATSTVWQNAPVAVSAPAGTSTALAFRSISAGSQLTCGITTNGDEYCWGNGYGSQPVLGWLGWGSQSGGPQASATSVSLGFSCRMDAHGVWCDGPSPSHTQAPRSFASSFTFLGQGTTAEHVCAIAASGTTWCWGDSSSGKLGNGMVINGRTQVNAPSPLNSVAAGSSHSCGLAGTIAYCWGSNSNGELGINTGPGGGSSAPRQVTNSANTAWRKISAGARHTCAVDTAGEIWCWGTNYMGQLGIGTSFVYNSLLGIEAVVTPVKTVGP